MKDKMLAGLAVISILLGLALGIFDRRIRLREGVSERYASASRPAAKGVKASQHLFFRHAAQLPRSPALWP